MALEKSKYTTSEDDKKVTRSTFVEKSYAKKRDVVGYVKGVQNLNVREKPNPNANILSTIPMGTAVTVKGDTGAYYQIVTPDLTEGYVLKGFLMVKR